MNTGTSDSGWQVLLVTNGSRKDFMECLSVHGVECFAPRMPLSHTDSGIPGGSSLSVEGRIPPVFSRLCLVHSDLSTLERIKGELPEGAAFSHVWDGTGFCPAAADDRTARDFMRVSEDAGDKVYLDRISPLLGEGRKVRVISGRLAGIEGRLVRVRKSLRVMVELPGKIAVATGYIRPECMEDR